MFAALLFDGHKVSSEMVSAVATSFARETKTTNKSNQKAIKFNLTDFYERAIV